jgi:hypothetical protein
MDSSEIARIRFVSENFGRLQGLRWACEYMAVLGYLWAYPRLARGGDEVLEGLLVFIVLCVFLLGVYWARQRAQEYYAERFGSTVAGDRNRRMDVAAYAALAGATVYDFTRLGVGGPSALLVTVAALTTMRAALDWPWRRHLAAAGALFGTMVLLMPLPVSGDHVRYVHTVGTILCTAGIVTGLLDHRLLRSVMARRDALAGEGL